MHRPLYRNEKKLELFVSKPEEKDEWIEAFQATGVYVDVRGTSLTHQSWVLLVFLDFFH